MALTLMVKFLADASQLAAESAKAGGGVEVLGKKLDVGVIAKGAAVAGAVGLAVTAIAGMTSAAAEDRAEQEKLALAIENAGAATAGSQEAIDAAIAAGQEKAFTDTEQRLALEALVGATGDVNKATTDMAIAQDIARASGVDLETAAKAVAKAEAGQDGALRKLLPGLAKGATAQDTIAAASKRAAGQADLYAASAKGASDKAGQGFDELQETIGEVFLPILDEIMPALSPILKAFGELVKALLPVLIPLVKLLAKYLGFAAQVLTKIVGVVVKVVTWFGNLIRTIGDLLNKIGPLRAIGDAIGGIIGGRAVTGAPAGLRAAPLAATGTAGWQGGGTEVTMVLNGEVFGRATIGALRGYDRRNGAAQVLPRWT